MRTFLAGLATLFIAAAFVSPSSAVPPGYPDCCYVYKPQAPDAVCGCPHYYTNAYGGVYGPNYNVYPPFLPWNGALPAANNGPPPNPWNPYVRSPRDYFMYEDLGR